jgi:hypothetical protein
MQTHLSATNVYGKQRSLYDESCKTTSTAFLRSKLSATGSNFHQDVTLVPSLGRHLGLGLIPLHRMGFRPELINIKSHDNDNTLRDSDLFRVGN